MNLWHHRQLTEIKNSSFHVRDRLLHFLGGGTILYLRLIKSIRLETRIPAKTWGPSGFNYPTLHQKIEKSRMKTSSNMNNFIAISHSYKQSPKAQTKNILKIIEIHCFILAIISHSDFVSTISTTTLPHKVEVTLYKKMVIPVPPCQEF